MKNVVSKYRLKAAMLKAGANVLLIKETLRQLGRRKRKKKDAATVKLKRKHFKAIAKKLNAHGLVVLRRLEHDHSRFRFVGPKMVTIRERNYPFRDREAAKKAAAKRHNGR
jgi:hypothetical protein